MKVNASSLWLLALSARPAATVAKIRGVTENKKTLTHEKRKLTQLMGYGGEPEHWRYPLGLCEGDCDWDSQCAGDLVCHQRDKYDPAPGCQGGPTFAADTDFCAPATDWTYSPWSTDAPTFAPVLNAIEEIGIPLEFVGDDIVFGLPLGMCQGDCDSDEDCLDDFICYQRDMFEPVPGCAGQGDASIDYCSKDWSGTVTVTNPPAVAPATPRPIGGSATLDDPLLTTVGDNLGLPLGLCEGDCDTDADCLDNLICFQREAWEYVPGCSGQGRISYDYCIMGPPVQIPETITPPPATSVPVVVVNPLRPPLTYVGDIDFYVFGTPLGLCQGDCDTDLDCLDNLVCQQRNAFEPVPGCSGSGIEGTDYCTVGFSGEENLISLAPQPAVTLPPHLQGMQLPVLQEVGDNLAYPLGMCQGDCDSDADCLDDMVCFQRDLLDPVPGCLGEGQISYDYCIVSQYSTRAPSTPALPPAMRPTSPNVPLPGLQTVGDNLALPLGLCQGDCDTDADCLDDLICFQRVYLEPVDGCSGAGTASYDYCTMGVGSTMSPTRAPIVLPPVPVGSQLPPLDEIVDDGNPKGLCQGDCDTDFDCLDNLVCFQRDFLEPVPGCSGMGQRSYDYCIVDPYGTPPAPTTAVALPAPSPGTQFLVLVVIGDGSNLPLGLCEGDCDTNADCLDNLVCFQRDLQEPVPGCQGAGRTSYDYCIADPSSPPGPTSPALPVAAPSMTPHPPLVEVGDGGFFALGLCQGDCDSDTDCLDSLICFQRNYFEPVPGCSGTGRASYDYCIENPNPPMPTLAPLTVTPATPQPVIPVTAQPVTAQPVTAQPITAQPVTAGTAQPVTAQPVTAPPVTARPVLAGTAQPVTAQPVTAPPVTAPPVTLVVIVEGQNTNPNPGQGTNPGFEIPPILGAEGPEAGQEVLPLTLVDSKDSKDDKKKDSYEGNQFGTTGGTGSVDDAGLGRCEGKCKKSEDCATGLFCFDSGSSGTVPGCSGNPFGYNFCIPFPTRKLKGVRRRREFQ